MEADVLKRVLSEQRKEAEKITAESSIVAREAMPYCLKFLKHPNILALLGVRRCGKSVFSLLISQALKEKTGYINFDDERLVGLATEDLNAVLQAMHELHGEIDLIFLDEIQNVPGWEMFANRLRRTKKVILTGSNSNLLSGELSAHLTGRHIDFTLFPFSFREALSFKPDIYVTEDIARVRSQLHTYLTTSSFPEFMKFGPEIVMRIYEDIVTKDCLIRHTIREREAFRELAKYLVSNFSSEFTYSKLSHIVGLKDVHTTKNYVAYLKESFLVFILERFSPKLKQQIIAPKKVYAADHGFSNFVGFKLSKNAGRIFENVVCIELLRRKSFNRPLEIYYWKDYLGNEVDFVVKDGRSVQQLIQVCYDIDDAATKQRELKALLKGSKELSCKNLTIITDSFEMAERAEGRTLHYIPLWKWLLSWKPS